MIFVDTGAWYALASVRDANHGAAQEWLTQNDQPLYTSDYVIDETVTLLRVRGERAKAVEFLELLRSSTTCQVVFLTPALIRGAATVFQKYHDKDWSFTDCTSKVVIEALGITKAFSFDQHFRQFGSVTVVP